MIPGVPLDHQIVFISAGEILYESCYVSPLRLCSVLYLVHNRLRWRDNESSTNFKSGSSHHCDHSVFHRCWFNGHIRHDHWLRIHSQFDGSMEWRTDRYDI
jgi:hypothetical protein